MTEAAKANPKLLVATHFGHFDCTSSLIKRVAAHHFPVDQMGPHLMEEVVTDIRKGYQGRLQLATDMLRIDI